MIRERIIRLHYDDDALGFIADEHIRAFQQTIGRMVSYGLRTSANDGIEFIDLYLDASGKITSSVYPAVSFSQSNADNENAPFFALNAVLDYFSRDEPTTMAAMPSGDGAYSFH